MRSADPCESYITCMLYKVIMVTDKVQTTYNIHVGDTLELVDWDLLIRVKK